MSYPPYQPKFLPNGKPNPKYIDLTKETDPPIEGQKYMVNSFISPEKILKDKSIFMFESFVKRWEFSKKMQGYTQFLNFISFKYNINSEDLNNDFADFLREEGEKLKSDSAVEDDYKTFIEKHGKHLEMDFYTKHNFRTSVRSIKNSGNFATLEQAQARAKEIRALFPGHCVSIGEVGEWGIWDPSNEERGDVEYAEEELNRLVHEKEKNAAISKAAFDTRVREAKETAIRENIKKAEKTGNTLTQNIDENGELYSVTTQETELRQMGENITEEDVRNVLFEGDNIVMDKNTDKGQSQLLSGPFATKKSEFDGN
jgi:hypothetical protein